MKNRNKLSKIEKAITPTTIEMICAKSIIGDILDNLAYNKDLKAYTDNGGIVITLSKADFISLNRFINR
jgi:hypothetical protein